MSWNEGKKEDISFFDNRPSLFLIGNLCICMNVRLCNLEHNDPVKLPCKTSWDI